MTDLVYSWGSIDNDINMLISLQPYDNKESHRVIGMDNDLVPATLVASRLNVPIIQVTDVNNLPLISNPINSGDGTLPDLPILVFVVSYASISNYDKINEIAARFIQIGHKVHIFALYSSQGSAHTFQYQWFVSHGTNITFPWKT